MVYESDSIPPSKKKEVPSSYQKGKVFKYREKAEKNPSF